MLNFIYVRRIDSCWLFFFFPPSLSRIFSNSNTFISKIKRRLGKKRASKTNEYDFLAKAFRRSYFSSAIKTSVFDRAYSRCLRRILFDAFLRIYVNPSYKGRAWQLFRIPLPIIFVGDVTTIIDASLSYEFKVSHPSSRQPLSLSFSQLPRTKVTLQPSGRKRIVERFLSRRAKYKKYERIAKEKSGSSGRKREQNKITDRRCESSVSRISWSRLRIRRISRSNYVDFPSSKLSQKGNSFRVDIARFLASPRAIA